MGGMRSEGERVRDLTCGECGTDLGINTAEAELEEFEDMHCDGCGGLFRKEDLNHDSIQGCEL